jgi:hypothetical protein
MVQISEGKRARPERLIGFVEGELEAARDARLRRNERCRRNNRREAKPEGPARLCLSPRVGGDGGIAAHVVAFALSQPSRPRLAVRRMPARFSSIIALLFKLSAARCENLANVLQSAHRRLAANVV